MAGNADLQRKLNQGVDAAKAGDRATARRLLEEVVAEDDRNEMAWIWLATVAPNASQRREYLRKVLAINPRNQRAREALAALGDDPVPSRTTAGSNRSGIGQAPTLQETIRRTDALAQQPRRGNSGLIFVIAAVALLLAGLGIILFGGGILGGTTAPTATAVVFVQGGPTAAPTNTPEPLPSSTPVPIELITRSAATLPPTPTASLTPTQTPSPQVTQPFELNEFEVVYISQDPAVPEPSMFMLQADGLNDGLLGDRIRDVTFAPDGFTFAFVRDVFGADERRIPEIFISTMADPNDARQLTNLGSPDTANPSFSPDANYIVFSSSNGRPAPDLWVIGVDGGTPAALTVSEDGEREPAWSPAGGMIAYTSDQMTLGSTEIFVVSVTADGEPLGGAVQATNADRNSYSPAWSPDGRTIVFASDRSGDGDVYTMDSQGNNEQRLTVDDNDAEDRRPGFSPDGRWIVFVSNREDGNFQTYVMRSNGTSVRRITNSFRVDIAAMFRPRDLNQ